MGRSWNGGPAEYNTISIWMTRVMQRCWALLRGMKGKETLRWLRTDGLFELWKPLALFFLCENESRPHKTRDLTSIVISKQDQQLCVYCDLNQHWISTDMGVILIFSCHYSCVTESINKWENLQEVNGSYISACLWLYKSFARIHWSASVRGYTSVAKRMKKGTHPKIHTEKEMKEQNKTNQKPRRSQCEDARLLLYYFHMCFLNIPFHSLSLSHLDIYNNRPEARH